MDYYNPILLQQLAPLVQVQISDSLKGTDLEASLVKHFNYFNIKGSTWDSSILKNRMSNMKYIINYKTSTADLDKYITKDPAFSLSPFSPSSDLYPNGILNVKWFKKYTNEIPFVVIQTYVLSEEVEDDKELVVQINEQKAKCQQLNIKFVAIIVSSNQDNPSSDDDRVIRLRNLTSLPKLTGLLYLNTAPTTLSRDAELVATSLLSNLKFAASEFYKNIEFRIKQRQKKYYAYPSTPVNINTKIELVPLFLETRNLIKQAIMHQFMSPHNLENCTRLLELSYQNMIEIFAGNFHEISTLTSHDLKMYVQVRQLIDILAFHIIRGHFSLDDPLSAIRKHKNHVESVIKFSREDELHNNNWISIQYEWLAQLMDSVPDSVLLNVNSSSGKKNDPKKKIQYFGGVQLLDKGLTNAPTNSSFLYLSAVGYLRKCNLTPLTADGSGYLFEFKDAESIRIYIIELLERTSSSLSLNLVRSQNNSENDDAEEQIDSLHTLLSYINWLIGEEYYGIYLLNDTKDNLSKATKYYEGCLHQFSSAGWSDIISIISAKLLLCYNKLDDYEKELGSIIKLAMSKPSEGQVSKNDHLLNKLSTFKLDEMGVNDFLSFDLLFVNPRGNVETHVFDDCLIQVKVHKELELKELKRFFSDDTQISLIIDSLTISIWNETEVKKEITIKHDNEGENSVFNEVSDSCNMKLSGDKIFKIAHSFDKPGQYRVGSITAKLRLIINGVELTKEEESTEFIQSSFFGTIFHKNNYRRQIRIDSNNSLKVSTLPPKLTLSFENDLANSVIVDEKLSIKVKFDYVKNDKIKYKKFFMTIKLKFDEDNDDENEIVTRVNWDNLKDDVSLDLFGLLENEAETHSLHINVHSKGTNASNVLLDFKCHVEEEVGDSEIIYDILSVPMKLVSQPFQCSCIISPRYSEDRIDMPSPFFVRENEVSMPIVTRVWKSDVGLQKMVQGIEIIEYDFSFKSSNNELNIEKIDGIVVSPNKVGQIFYTRSKSGYTHRNVVVLTSLRVQWKREGQEVVNEFNSKEWAITLPLADPRLLLKAQRLEDGVIWMKYIVENPTPRIFTFTTELVQDQEWEFSDVRNLIAEKQSIFPVLPFSQHEMEFYGKSLQKSSGTASKQVTKLPSFKVFDVQYKVALPALSVSDSVVLKDSQLVLAEN